MMAFIPSDCQRPVPQMFQLFCKAFGACDRLLHLRDRADIRGQWPTASPDGMMAPPSPEPDDRQPPRAGLRREALSLLAGLALGTAALFLGKPAQACAVSTEEGTSAIAAPSEDATVRHMVRTGLMRPGESGSSVASTRIMA
jgi:hypothetical protein